MTITKWELLNAIEEKIDRVDRINRIVLVLSYGFCCIVLITCMFLTNLENIVQICVNIVFVVIFLCFCFLYNTFRKIKKLEIVFEAINYYCDDGEGGIEIEI